MSFLPHRTRALGRAAALVLFATACGDPLTSTRQLSAPEAPAASSGTPYLCDNVTKLCTGVADNATPRLELLIVCKVYPEGTTSTPSVLVRIDVSSTNPTPSPKKLTYTVPGNLASTPAANLKCLRLWSNGEGGLVDEVRVTELSLEGYTTTTQLTTIIRTSPRGVLPETQVTNVGPTVNSASVLTRIGGPGIPGALVTFTNTPNPVPGKPGEFWARRKGIDIIEDAGGYAANAVALGRASNIDTQAKSVSVLFPSLKACDANATIIFSDQTASTDCSLASGVSKAALNGLSGQALALAYNSAFVSGYSGNTINVLSCNAYLTGGLTGASGMSAAFNAAVQLIQDSGTGGTTTQAQLVAMTQLLSCLNND